jgi:homoserine dehydrogenase
MEPDLRIIIIGFGTVGRSFAEIVQERSESLRRLYGIAPQVVAIVDRGGAIIDEKGVNISEALSKRNSHESVAQHRTLGHQGVGALDVIKTVEADVLLELTPTNVTDGEPGLTHIESALKNDLNVITTNKGPLAVAMPALLELARYQGVDFRFSGTVGGGTQLLKFAKECLAGDRVLSVEGVLNGTTNYILTQMFKEGVSMSHALKEARDFGYAEADPRFDIDGIDTAIKLVIISNWVMGGSDSIRDVMIEGISSVTFQEIEESKRQNKEIKLVGSTKDYKLSVRPRAISLSNPLCVDGILNAVLFKTELAGEITLCGRGAGGRETASSVLRDLIDIKKRLAM